MEEQHLSSNCLPSRQILDFSFFLRTGRPKLVVHWCYGPQEDEEKMMFLQELRNIHSLCNGPWLVAGDFNLIYQAANKNNANLDRAMMGRFRRFFWMMLRLRKFLFWVANTLGRMREDLPPLSDWIGLSFVLVGKISFLTQCYKVQRQQSLTIALSSWG